MNSALLKKYIPLTIWIVAGAILILIPLKIISYGFLPMDDALRHAAKTVSGKSWQEILVMRSDFKLDPNPGWQKILEWVHAVVGGNAETLVVFSVVALMLLVFLSGLPWLRRPEAWLAALCVASVFAPACTTRFARGRPYLLTDAVVITAMFLWSRVEKDRPPALTTIATTLLIAASAWIHGSWYLLSIPAAAILFTGYWRSAITYGFCWLLGSFLGCSLTGHPWEFLFQAVRHMIEAFGGHPLARLLVPEFQPSDGGTGPVLVMGVLLLWRKVTPDLNFRQFWNPFFTLALLGWLLGLTVNRFWWDWGLPAFICWMALEFQAQLERHLPLDSLKRLFIAVALAAGVYLGFTADRESRWTQNLTTEFFTPQTPDAAGWLPGTNGIIYSSSMDVFFKMFYKNPTAPWRYDFGFEPGLMRPEDLDVLRKIQWNFGDPRAYEPWVKEMRPEDRLMIDTTGTHSGPPYIPELEWDHPVGGLWVGRLPVTTNSSPASPASAPGNAATK